MWPALISAGASIFGSIFGGGDKQTTTSSVDYDRMVRSAEKAGFNPLTALRNGGSAGFSTMTTSGTPLSSRIASGVADATQDFMANFDPFKDQKREMEIKLVEAQLANLQADTAAKVRFGDVPSFTAGPHKSVIGSGVQPGQTFKSVADVLGPPTPPEAGKTTATNPWQDAAIDAAVRDADNMEQRYGDSELATMLYGGYVANSDMRVNSPRYSRFGNDAAGLFGGLGNFPQKYDSFLDRLAVSSPANVVRHGRSNRSAKTGRLPYRPPLSHPTPGWGFW
ncbi:hypothetical protein NKI50_12650 [Mesorhizobium sp. M0563]|uniref:hypothetical protein n=1 Tax=Mesorhizobium sp. M0563 TaxID=2956959 RepID=UPI003337E44E